MFSFAGSKTALDLLFDILNVKVHARNKNGRRRQKNNQNNNNVYLKSTICEMTKTTREVVIENSLSSLGTYMYMRMIL